MGKAEWMLFEDRVDAGQRLAVELAGYRDQAPLVLGLPRGGVPVAYEVAVALGAPLDVWVVRKIGAPFQPEFGLGAVAEGGEVVWNDETLGFLGLTTKELSKLAAAEDEEVQRRVRVFRGRRPQPEITGRTVILVDDGIATGGTVHAAIRSLRKKQPAQLVLAVPVAASQTLGKLRAEVDDLVCLEPTPYLTAVGLYYRDFSQTSDEDVVQLLDRARALAAAA